MEETRNTCRNIIKELNKNPEANEDLEDTLVTNLNKIYKEKFFYRLNFDSLYNVVQKANPPADVFMEIAGIVSKKDPEDAPRLLNVFEARKESLQECIEILSSFSECSIFKRLSEAFDEYQGLPELESEKSSVISQSDTEMGGFIQSIKEKDLIRMEALMENFNKQKNQHSICFKTLKVAIETNDGDVLDTFIKNSHFPIESILITVIEKGNLSMLEHLIEENKIDINKVISFKPPKSNYPIRTSLLQQAIRYCQKDIVKYLTRLEKRTKNPEYKKTTKVNVFRANKDIYTICAILKKKFGYTGMIVIGKEKVTPFMYAVDNKETEAIIDLCSYEITECNGGFENSLLYAVSKENVEACNAILESGNYELSIEAVKAVKASKNEEIQNLLSFKDLILNELIDNDMDARQARRLLSKISENEAERICRNRKSLGLWINKHTE